MKGSNVFLQNFVSADDCFIKFDNATRSFFLITCTKQRIDLALKARAGYILFSGMASTEAIRIFLSFLAQCSGEYGTIRVYTRSTGAFALLKAGVVYGLAIVISL